MPILHEGVQRHPVRAESEEARVLQESSHGMRGVHEALFEEAGGRAAFGGHGFLFRIGEAQEAAARVGGGPAAVGERAAGARRAQVCGGSTPRPPNKALTGGPGVEPPQGVQEEMRVVEAGEHMSLDHGRHGQVGYGGVDRAFGGRDDPEGGRHGETCGEHRLM